MAYKRLEIDGLILPIFYILSGWFPGLDWINQKYHIQFV